MFGPASGGGPRGEPKPARAGRVRIRGLRPLSRRVHEGGALNDEAELAPLPDERLVVDLLKRGDRQAAATLYAWYGDCLFREVILPRLPVRELAEDVLRDTFRLVLAGLVAEGDEGRPHHGERAQRPREQVAREARAARRRHAAGSAGT